MRLLPFGTLHLRKPDTDPKQSTCRIVYPLTAQSQPRLDQLGTTKVDKTGLALGWVSYHDAKYACEHWHYSGSLPAGKTVKVGVFEQAQFIGVVIFSRGATAAIGKPYALAQTEICELTRVALTAHKSPVTQIVAEAIRMVKTCNPGLRLIVSYAALEEGHHGGIYQAGNWIYVGKIDSYKYRVGDNLWHGRRVSAAATRRSLSTPAYLKSLNQPVEKVFLHRHKYLLPLDRKMRRQVEKLAAEYPERIKG